MYTNNKIFKSKQKLPYKSKLKNIQVQLIQMYLIINDTLCHIILSRFLSILVTVKYIKVKIYVRINHVKYN